MNKLRIKEEDLELVGVDSRATEILYYNGKPFTGVCLIYEKEGWLSVEKEFENGFQQGWIRDFYQNGQVETELKMDNNVIVEGTFIAFNENGDPL